MLLIYEQTDDTPKYSRATRLLNGLNLLAGLAQVGRRNAALRRWFIGNRLRQLTVRAEYTLRNDGYSAPPRSISFRPTFLCNARCKMCSYANSIEPDSQRPITRREEAISLEVAKRLADAIAPSHTMLNITGGEPFVWGDHLFAFLEYCHERRVATTVTTNGTFLGRNLERLAQTSPDVLILSLLGPEETHNRIVGLPAFERFRGPLLELLERKGGDRWKPPLVVTNTALLPENTDAFVEVARISHELGAIAANFQPIWVVTEAMHQAYEEHQEGYDRRFTSCHQVRPKEVLPDVLWQQMLNTRALAAEMGHPVYFYPRLRQQDMHVYYHQPEQPIGRSRALCAHLFSQVLPDGTVTPCLGHVAGNLYEQDFLEIWNGPVMRDFRKNLKAARMFPICSRCCFLWRND